MCVWGGEEVEQEVVIEGGGERGGALKLQVVIGDVGGVTRFGGARGKG